MGSNSFGKRFAITTWGESHGLAMGVVIDGCPAGLPLNEEDLNRELSYRCPGKGAYTTPRIEEDRAEILSGIWEGETTGAPLSILIRNLHAQADHYEPIKNLLRPGHANFTYLKKYGRFDYRGGGRASARETVCRVAAGAVAKKILQIHSIYPIAFLRQIGPLSSPDPEWSRGPLLYERIRKSPVFCPDVATSRAMEKFLTAIKDEGESVGGLVEGFVPSLPVGLGDPVYGKIPARLAEAMMSIPAAKGFEIGEGFRSVLMKGSEHNDLFFLGEKGQVSTHTNHSGGTLGGISTGKALSFRIAFKPTPSIQKTQQTLSVKGEPKLLQLPEGSRHDPCVAIRAVPVVEAMTALVLVDVLLLNQGIRLDPEED